MYWISCKPSCKPCNMVFLFCMTVVCVTSFPGSLPPWWEESGNETIAMGWSSPSDEDLVSFPGSPRVGMKNGSGNEANRRCHTPNFAEKLSYKTSKVAEIFSLESFPLCASSFSTVCDMKDTVSRLCSTSETLHAI